MPNLAGKIVKEVVFFRNKVNKPQSRGNKGNKGNEDNKGNVDNKGNKGKGNKGKGNQGGILK